MPISIEQPHFNTNEPPFPIAKPLNIPENGITRWTLDTLTKSRGSMSEVVYGWDRKLGRRVACKILFGSYVHDHESKEALKREAKELANIRHPNIVEVYDFVFHERRGYIIMEHVYPGRTI